MLFLFLFLFFSFTFSCSCSSCCCSSSSGSFSFLLAFFLMDFRVISVLIVRLFVGTGHQWDIFLIYKTQTGPWSRPIVLRLLTLLLFLFLWLVCVVGGWVFLSVFVPYHGVACIHSGVRQQ